MVREIRGEDEMKKQKTMALGSMRLSLYCCCNDEAADYSVELPKKTRRNVFKTIFHPTRKNETIRGVCVYQSDLDGIAVKLEELFLSEVSKIGGGHGRAADGDYCHREEFDDEGDSRTVRVGDLNRGIK